MNIFIHSVYDYFRDHYRHVLNLTTDTLDDPSPENFHQLRVRLKRIRFVGKFLKEYGKSKALPYFKPYAKLFRYAGRIRENHVQVSLLRKYGSEFSDDTKLALLKKKERRLIKKWAVVAIPSLAEIVHSYLSIEKKISGCTVNSTLYLKDWEQHLIHCFNTEIADNKLHQTRKTLKGILYSAELSTEFKRSINHFCNLKVATSLEDAIGDWHDLDTAMMQCKWIHEKTVGRRLIKQKHRERAKINKFLPKLIRTTKSSSIQ